MYVYEKITVNDDPDSDPIRYVDFTNENWLWEENEDDKTTNIRISNTADDVTITAAENMAFRVRIFIPEDDLDEVQSGSYNLKMQVNGRTYTATSDYLRDNTPIHKATQNKGWVYSFTGSDGKELLFQLKGGIESNVDITLLLPHTVVIGENGQQIYEVVDTTAFKLIVDRIPPVEP